MEADRVADDVLRVLHGLNAEPSSMSGFGQTGVTRITRRASVPVRDDGRDLPAPGPEVGWAGGAISGELSNRITRSGGGVPLGEATRSRMELGFGRSFADVRVHADSDLPRQVAADAFTTGTHLHFSPGQYDPSSSAGERLLAHELTHVVQQGGGVARHAHATDPPRVMRTTANIAREPVRVTRRDSVPIIRRGGVDPPPEQGYIFLERITKVDEYTINYRQNGNNFYIEPWCQGENGPERAGYVNVEPVSAGVLTLHTNMSPAHRGVGTKLLPSRCTWCASTTSPPMSSSSTCRWAAGRS